MLSIDAKTWLEAVKATEWHRSQVQTFLYPVGDVNPRDNGWRAGAHVIRDCTLDPDKQVIFREVDMTGERYDEIDAQAREVSELYQTCITINEYERLRKVS